MICDCCFEGLYQIRRELKSLHEGMRNLKKTFSYSRKRRKVHKTTFNDKQRPSNQITSWKKGKTCCRRYTSREAALKSKHIERHLRLGNETVDNDVWDAGYDTDPPTFLLPSQRYVKI